MMRPDDSLKRLQEAGRGIEHVLDEALLAPAQPDTRRLYDMLRYFLGFVDQDFAPAEVQAGKRFRPALCLFLAQCYDIGDKAVSAAAAIELFHNFTLIHDDIEDRDEYRRGRPTVWKLWGINHAINSGDVQSLIVGKLSARAAAESGESALADLLLDAFIEVGEGQYLDFEMTTAPISSEKVNEGAYMRMIEKKSGVLVRVSAEVPGMIAHLEVPEREALREFGLTLGAAYQVADDFRSIWSTTDQTGKDTCSDVREHKRTYPAIVAFASLSGVDRERLTSLYELSRQLTDGEIREAVALIEKTGARDKTLELIREMSARAKSAIGRLSIPDVQREVLVGVVDALVPEGDESVREAHHE